VSDVIAPEHLAPEVRASLESAVAHCRAALADYRAGVLDEAELRDALYHGGLVARGGEAWMLDVQAGCWWRFDGVGVDQFPSARVASGFARLRSVIDELAAARADRNVAQGGPR
jgi:hypothetical protein